MKYAFTRDEKNLVYFFILALLIGSGLAMNEESSSDLKKSGKFSNIKSIKDVKKTKKYSLNKIETKPVLHEAAKVNLVPQFPIDPCKASVQDLMAIPGVGRKTALSILASLYGNPQNCTEQALLKVKGIGQKKMEKIGPYLILAKNNREQLNTIEQISKLKQISKTKKLKKIKTLKNTKRIKKNRILKTKVKIASRRIELNCAEYEDFIKIKGIGPCIAKRILEYRKEKKRDFSTFEELVNVKGISSKSMSRLRRWFYVETEPKRIKKEVIEKSIVNNIVALASVDKVDNPEWSWKKDYKKIFRAFPEFR